jgi:hypothetical protein
MRDAISVNTSPYHFYLEGLKYCIMTIWLSQVILLVLTCTHSFKFTSHFRETSRSRLFQGGKGFGKKNEIKPEPRIQESKTGANRAEVEPATDALDAQIKGTQMFQNMNARRVMELEEKIQKLKDEDDLIASDPSVGAVPELVANRMISRIAVFFGVPVFGGIALFIAAIVAAKKYDTTVPPYIMAYATQTPFILGLMGITYAILSSSWDDAPGSALGIEEFKTNFGRIKEGLERTKDTAELRDEIETEKKKLGR